MIHLKKHKMPGEKNNSPSSAKNEKERKIQEE
jgi:hypothetical protein